MGSESKYPKCPKCGMGLVRFDSGPARCVDSQCGYVEPNDLVRSGEEVEDDD